MIKVLPLVFLLAACGTNNYTITEPPVAYPSSCPDTDTKCQRNLDAQTLAYIGHSKAATTLMCGDPELKKVIGDACGSTFSLY